MSWSNECTNHFRSNEKVMNDIEYSETNRHLHAIMHSQVPWVGSKKFDDLASG